MRSVLVLWWVMLLPGIATYTRWYVPHLFRKWICAVVFRGMRLKIVTITLLLMLSAGAQFSLAQSGTPSVPEANPGRPTVSTPATLTPVGYLQFENGALFAEDSAEFSKRFGIEQVTKLSVLPRLELFLQSEPLAFSQSENQTAVHEG
jgi:hypothetical protein